jgi:hypothetical protein
MCGKIKACKQKLSELKKYEKGAYKIVFRYLNPSYYIKAN